MSLLDNFQMKKKQITALFLGISAIVGVILLVLFLFPRSEPGNQLMLGLSASRVFIGVIFAGLLLINIVAMLLAAMNLGPWQKELEKNVTGFFLDKQTIVMMALYAVLILSGAFLLLIIPPVIRPLSFLEQVSTRLGSFLGWIFFASLLLIVLLRLIAAETLHNNRVVTRLDEILTYVSLFLVVFVLYAHIAALIGWVNKTKYSYWDLLAGALLKGKLYIENPPYTHDLTLFNGKWYVPMPPLPAFLFLPIAYLVGAENFSTSYLSMVFSAINGVLVLLILKQLVQRKWINLSRNGMFWLVVVFLFGTPHLWVGISGRGWYVSQILTVLFLALAIYAALRSWSAWLVASFIAIAMLARPNGLLTWPFVFAISMQILKENQGRIELKQAILWSAKTVLPIVIAIIGLLTYNYLRFDNFLDFGYTTVNAGPDIVQNVQTYGLFSPHFIPTNLQVMLFKMPRINWGAPWPANPRGAMWPIDPTTTGMSIFLTTPPLLYLFRRYPKQWWILGAWVAVLFNIIMLSFYSNTGSAQFGYRYILDFLVPLVAMLAVGLGKRVPWHFIALVLVSIAINIFGAYWFMNG
ncbi:MAG: hypothetical protein M1485_06945 [Chloroflexi bacterium]|nr:hypothetical protein [Chloroflexota bacterium]